MNEDLMNEINACGGLVDISHYMSAPLFAIKNTKRILSETERLSLKDNILTPAEFISDGHGTIRIFIGKPGSPFYGQVYQVS